MRDDFQAGLERDDEMEEIDLKQAWREMTR
jgi:hypothetical protein